MKPFQFTALAPAALAVIAQRRVLRTGPRFAIGATDRGRVIKVEGIALRDLPFKITHLGVKDLPAGENAKARARQLASCAEVDPERSVVVTLEGSEDEIAESALDCEFFRGVLAALDYPGWRAALAAGDRVWENSEQTDDDCDRSDEARDEALLQLGTAETREWVTSRGEAAASSPRESRSVAE